MSDHHAHQPPHHHSDHHGEVRAHHHHGGHRHDHHAPARFDRAFATGIALNLGFVLIEGVYGWRTDSLALLADAGHNLSDVAGLVLAWGGALAGRLRPDARRTYGWKRASILAAFGNALLLLVAMGALGWEAVQRFSSPQPMQGWTVMAVAGVGIAINGATALLFMRGSHDDLNLRGAFLHMAADALVSAGVVVAGGLALWQGWLWIDPTVSLLITVIIVVGTWDLFRQSLHLLFDGVPRHVNWQEVRAALLELPGVTAVLDLHIWALGATEVALTAHLVVPDHAPDPTFYEAAHALLRERFHIRHSTLQVAQRPVGQLCDL